VAASRGAGSGPQAGTPACSPTLSTNRRPIGLQAESSSDTSAGSWIAQLAVCQHCLEMAAHRQRAKSGSWFGLQPEPEGDGQKFIALGRRRKPPTIDGEDPSRPIVMGRQGKARSFVEQEASEQPPTATLNLRRAGCRGPSGRRNRAILEWPAPGGAGRQTIPRGRSRPEGCPVMLRGLSFWPEWRLVEAEGRSLASTRPACLSNSSPPQLQGFLAGGDVQRCRASPQRSIRFTQQVPAARGDHPVWEAASAALKGAAGCDRPKRSPNHLECEW